MVAVTIKTNFPQVRDKLDVMGKQARYAMAVAITRTARDVQAAIRADMQSKLDRPKPYALGAVYATTATRDTLTATVGLKQPSSGVDSFLAPQITGGPTSRPQKPFEHALVTMGLLRPSEEIVPAGGTPLDQFGNPSRALIRSILASLQAGPSKAIRRNAKRRKGTKGAPAPMYVYIRRGKFVGIWQTKPAFRAVLLFVPASAVHYPGKPVDFDKVGGEAAEQRLIVNYETELAKALATAR